MKKIKLCLLAALVSAAFVACKNGDGEARTDTIKMYRWDRIPPAEGENVQPGLAGAFSGVVGNTLLIAGGANFPDGMPWHEGKKRWHDRLYAKNLDNGRWRECPGVFPRPLAYGVSFTIPQGVLCIGGCDARQAYADVFVLTCRDGEIRRQDWPSLPAPLSNMCGAVVDGVVYLAGGQDNMEAPQALPVFYALDTKNVSKGWQSLPSWPGSPRGYAVAASQSDGVDNCFFLFSGRDYGPGRETRPLTDAYKYNPRTKHWTRLDEVGRFSVMAGTAFATGAAHIMLIGGSDNQSVIRENALRKKIEEFSLLGWKDSMDVVKAQLIDLLDHHPGFGDKVFAYHTTTNSFFEFGATGISIPVTTNIVKNGEEYLITSGEVSPGIRTSDIYGMSIVFPKRSIGMFNWIIIVIYFAILLFMGFFFARR